MMAVKCVYVMSRQKKNKKTWMECAHKNQSDSMRICTVYFGVRYHYKASERLFVCLQMYSHVVIGLIKAHTHTYRLRFLQLYNDFFPSLSLTVLYCTLLNVILIFCVRSQSNRTVHAHNSLCRYFCCWCLCWCPACTFCMLDVEPKIVCGLYGTGVVSTAAAQHVNGRICMSERKQMKNAPDFTDRPTVSFTTRSLSPYRTLSFSLSMLVCIHI